MIAFDKKGKFFIDNTFKTKRKEKNMRLVHSFNYKPNKYESLILGYLTYSSARLFNVGLY